MIEIDSEAWQNSLILDLRDTMARMTWTNPVMFRQTGAVIGIVVLSGKTVVSARKVHNSGEEVHRHVNLTRHECGIRIEVALRIISCHIG